MDNSSQTSTETTGFYADPNSKLKDIEERQKILKDRVILMGKTLVEDRDKNFKEIQEMKKIISKMKEENDRLKEIISRMTEQLDNVARREELSTIQRQLDLLRR